MNQILTLNSSDDSTAYELANLVKKDTLKDVAGP